MTETADDRGDSVRSNTPPRRRRRGRVVLVGLGVAAVVCLAVWYVVIPYPWTLRTRDPERTSLMEQRVREARAAGHELEIRQEWVALEDISPRLVRAVLVAEDYRFREHAGIDWVSLAEEVHWSGDDDFSWTSASDLAALRRALGYVWANRSELRGRSTITQQLAKNLYFGTDRSLLRKAMEFVVARRLERRLGKDRILELYLNVVELGPGVFGVEAAARAYFGRSAADVTLEQAAALAGTLPHPLSSNPAFRPGRMEWRRNLILARLAPSAGVPSTPMPLPEPEPDLGGDLGIGDPDAMPLDLLPPARDSTATPPDSAATPPDSTAILRDSTLLPIDSTTIRRDTTVAPGDSVPRDTIPGIVPPPPAP